MIDLKEYTRLRDIAQKRIKRSQEKGLNIDLRIPTIRELRIEGEKALELAFKDLRNYIKSGITLNRQRKLSENPAAKKSREYRRTKVAKEYAREDYPTKYQEYLKGLETLHMDIPPSKLPGFFAYMDFRFSQGAKGEKKYVFDNFVDDYLKLLEKGYNPENIVSDFEKFEADQAMIEERAGNMSGMNYEKAQGLWDQFIDEID